MYTQKNIRRLMDKNCDAYGHSPKAVLWHSSKTQYERFRVLSHITSWKGDTLLDVGCGQGDFFSYLKSKKFPIRYAGIDLSKKMIDIAETVYPQGRFYEGDFLDKSFEASYDFLLCSGAFNYRVSNQDAFISDVIAKLWRLSTKGVGFNLLSTYTPKECRYDDFLYYYDPQKIFSLCLKFTPYVAFKQNYLPNDFTLFLYHSLQEGSP